MKKLVSLLLCGVMIIGTSLPVFAETADLSDVPFDYMTNLKTRNSYESLSTGAKKLVYSIPENVPTTLTTEAFLETILNNEYLIDLLMYDDFIMAVKSREAQFRIVEFLNREDSSEILSSYISNYRVELEKSYSADMDLKLEFLEKLKANSNLIVNNLESPVARIISGVVQTKAGNNVPCYMYRGWVNTGTTESRERARKLVLQTTYPTIEVEGADISPAYNCHSYAWYSTDFTTNNVWIEGQTHIQMFLNEAPIITENPQIGLTKVLYYYHDGNGPVNHVAHSAKVYGLTENGEIATLVSKWGNNSLFIHYFEDCPYYYSDIIVEHRNY